jgi:hypothetical protein
MRLCGSFGVIPNSKLCNAHASRQEPVLSRLGTTDPGINEVAVLLSARFSCAPSRSLRPALPPTHKRTL